MGNYRNPPASYWSYWSCDQLNVCHRLSHNLAMFLETTITAFIILILCALVCVRQDVDLTSVSEQPPAPVDHSVEPGLTLLNAGDH